MNISLELGNLLVAANIGLLVSTFLLRNEQILERVRNLAFYGIITVLLFSSVLVLLASEDLLKFELLAAIGLCLVFGCYIFLFLTSTDLIIDEYQSMMDQEEADELVKSETEESN